jgi:hypothetical protein
MLKKVLLGIVLTVGLIGSSIVYTQSETAGDEIFPPLPDGFEAETSIHIG